MPDAKDNCPNTANHRQTDTDGDGKGDMCDDTAPTKSDPSTTTKPDPPTTTPGPTNPNPALGGKSIGSTR